MIIKSYIRGGYRAAADYLKDIGKNEKTRLVEISDPDAKNLDEAFQNMWAVAANGKSKKPLHHISINPFKDERLTDEQVLKIVARAEQKYGYKPNDHQRVIVEHVKDGRQHFHVVWNRVSLTTGKVVKSGEHWKKSKQAAREMETELGLKRPTPRRGKSPRLIGKGERSASGRKISTRHHGASTQASTKAARFSPLLPPSPKYAGRTVSHPAATPEPNIKAATNTMARGNNNQPPTRPKPMRPNNLAMRRSEHIAWAWENQRYDILAMYGIYVGTEP